MAVAGYSRSGIVGSHSEVPFRRMAQVAPLSSSVREELLSAISHSALFLSCAGPALLGRISAELLPAARSFSLPLPDR